MAQRDVKLRLTAEDKATRLVKLLKDALVELGEEQNDVTGSSKQTGGAINRLAAALKGLENTTRNNRSAKRLSQDSKDASVSIEKLEASVASLKGELDRLKKAQADSAANVKKQQASVRELSQEYDTQRARLRALQSTRQQALNAEAKAIQDSAANQAELSAKARMAEQAVNEQNATVLRLKERLDGAKQSLRAAGSEQRNLAKDTRTTGAALKAEEAALDQARNSTRQLATADNALASAKGRATTGTQRLRDALRQFYGEGRRALSITQRLRGEVLSLATSYFGFFAAFQGIGSAIDALQTLEGAQSRLNAIFDGDQSAAADELDFIRRAANRLGIEFGVMAEQYTKFLAATKNTAIEGNTRQIFIATAEAARVNKLSIDQLQGTLVALSQIASKGAVQMEELRQQLGDRLPGAIQILADGLGIGTDELIKMLEQGEITSEALVNFAQELDRRFGGQLEKALNTTTTAMGRLQNTVFKASLALAQEFEPGFRKFLQQASETLESADFQATLENVGQVISGIFELLATGVENFRLVLITVVAILSAKLIPLVNIGIVSFLNFANALRGRATPEMGTFNRAVVLSTTAMRGAGGAATTLTARIRLLGAAFKGFLASTGIGLAFVAITTLMTAMATSADDATEALNSQRKIVDSLRDAHDAGAETAEDYADVLERISALDAARNLIAIRKEAKSLNVELATILERAGDQSGNVDSDRFTRGLGRITNAFGTRFSEDVQAQIREVTQAFLDGATTAQEFEKALSDIADAEGLTDDQIEKLGAFSDKAFELKEGMADLQRAQAINTLATEGSSEAARQAALDFLTMDDAAQEAGDGLDLLAGRASGLEAVINELKEGIPELKEEMDRLSETAEVSKLLKDAGLPETVEGLRQLADQFDRLGTASLVQRLGLDIDGSKVREVLDLVERRLEVINKPSGKKDPFGDALKRLEDALESDRLSLAADRLRRDNQELAAVTMERAAQFDRFFESVDIPPDQRARVAALREEFLALGESLVDEENAQAAADAIEKLGEAVRNAQADLRDAQADTPAERLAAFQAQQEEYINSIFEGVTLTEQDIETKNRLIEAYKAATTAVFQLDEAERQRQERQTAAADAEERVNNLISLRAELIKQLEFAQANNDSTQVDALRESIMGLTDQMDGAIDKAIEFWRAVGGEEAELAIAKLETLRMSLANDVEKPLINLREIGPLMVNELSSAFSTFAQKVAETGDVFGSIGEAFRQFASNFLIRLGEMIMQQLLFNAISGMFPGLFPVGAGGAGNVASGAAGAASGGGGGFGQMFGAVGGFLAGLFHSGRTGNTPTQRTRRVDPSVFMGAPKFHSGRMAGLKSDEMAAILKKSEDVVTEDDPRHSSNFGKGRGGGTQPARMDAKIVNVIDGTDVLQAALADTPGQEVILNFMRKRSREVNAALGSNRS